MMVQMTGMCTPHMSRVAWTPLLSHTDRHAYVWNKLTACFCIQLNIKASERRRLVRNVVENLIKSLITSLHYLRRVVACEAATKKCT